RDLHSFPTRRSSDLGATVPFSAPRAPARLGCGVSGGTQAVVVLSPAPVSPPPPAVAPTRSAPITTARRQLYSKPASADSSDATAPTTGCSADCFLAVGFLPTATTPASAGWLPRLNQLGESSARRSAMNPPTRTHPDC